MKWRMHSSFLCTNTWLDINPSRSTLQSGLGVFCGNLRFHTTDNSVKSELTQRSFMPYEAALIRQTLESICYIELANESFHTMRLNLSMFIVDSTQ